MASDRELIIRLVHAIADFLLARALGLDVLVPRLELEAARDEALRSCGR
jgi:hypothetical protein